MSRSLGHQNIWCWGVEMMMCDRGIQPKYYQRVAKLRHHRSLHRYEYCQYYSWAIPSNKAIEAIAKYAPIVEIGAAGGYWASLIVDHTSDPNSVKCFDTKEWGSDQEFHDYRPAKQWHPCDRGDHRVLKEYPDHNLFLCWPPMSQMAAECLTHFKGMYLIYVGESDGGCTADKAFFRLLKRKYREIDHVPLLQWSGINDRLWIYQRK